MNTFDLFTLLFVYLRLTGQIDWNWFFVLLPSIIRAILLLLVEIGKELEKVKRS